MQSLENGDGDVLKLKKNNEMLPFNEIIGNCSKAVAKFFSAKNLYWSELCPVIEEMKRIFNEVTDSSSSSDGSLNSCRSNISNISKDSELDNMLEHIDLLWTKKDNRNGLECIPNTFKGQLMEVLSQLDESLLFTKFLFGSTDA